MINNRDQFSALALPHAKQIAFLLLIFERMLPSLAAFSEDTGLDSSCYLKARDLAWDELLEKVASPADLARLNELCLRSAPDTEDFTHQQTSFALNAALLMSDALEFIVSGKADLIEHASTLATDSVYLYLSGLEPSLITTSEKIQRIAAHPLMQEERERQRADIRFLAGLPDPLDKNAIASLKIRAANQTPLLPTNPERPNGTNRKR